VIVTFDANVLVYATMPGEVHVTLRKSRYAADRVEGLVGAWMAAHSINAASADDVSAALACVRDHKLQFWDAMLWATARRVGVHCLVTEDLQDGRMLGGVRFVNPFVPANAERIDQVLPP
jgi:predicted nucleic acid-binding protein